MLCDVAWCLCAVCVVFVCFVFIGFNVFVCFGDSLCDGVGHVLCDCV